MCFDFYLLLVENGQKWAGGGLKAKIFFIFFEPEKS
jgi:hypothetical protein